MGNIGPLVEAAVAEMGEALGFGIEPYPPAAIAERLETALRDMFGAGADLVCGCVNRAYLVGDPDGGEPRELALFVSDPLVASELAVRSSEIDGRCAELFGGACSGVSVKVSRGGYARERFFDPPGRPAPRPAAGRAEPETAQAPTLAPDEIAALAEGIADPGVRSAFAAAAAADTGRYRGGTG